MLYEVITDRGGKADPLPPLDDRRVDSHDLALQVEQGPSRVSGVDRCVGLDEIVVRTGADHPPLGAHDPRCDGVPEAERVSYGHDPLPDFQPLRVPKRGERELLPCLDLDSYNFV